jgi:hypothetical protein
MFVENGNLITIIFTINQTRLKNLNKVIDYIRKEGENSNKRHRPVGLECRIRCIMCFVYLYIEAKKLNQEILKPYTAAVTASMEMAKRRAHSSFEGSPMSRRIQYNMGMKMRLSGRWDWVLYVKRSTSVTLLVPMLTHFSNLVTMKHLSHILQISIHVYFRESLSW